MIICFDVQYHSNQASVAALIFQEWTDEKPVKTYLEIMEGVADYQSGSFYLRELPCVTILLDQVKEPVTTIIIDGYVYLSSDKKPGLGAYLHDALSVKVPVIGVAKNQFKGYEECEKVYRGNSKKPLFITSVGIDTKEAAANILQMAGKYRIPTLLREVDALAREGTKKIAQ